MHAMVGASRRYWSAVPFSALERARRRTVAADEIGKIEAGDLAVLHRPAPADHDAIRPVRAAEHKRCERIAVAGKAQLVEPKQGEVGHAPDGERAELRSAEASRGALRYPPQRVAMADSADAVAAALEQECRARLLHQVRAVVRRRAVDAEADRNAGPLQITHRTGAGGE